MFRGATNMTPQRVGAPGWVHLALPCLSLLKTTIYCFTLHFIAELSLWSLNRRLTKELLVRFQRLLAVSLDFGPIGEPQRFFWIEVLLLVHLWCPLSRQYWSY